jgi:hypothetical protein
MPTHRFISSQSDQYHNQTRFGPLDNAHMYICSMQLATPLLPFLAKRPITHILYDFCAISFSTTRTITYVLYMPQLDHSQKCPVPYSETQCAAKPRHCTLHECRGSQILAQTSIGQNLDVALPEHVARFYVTSRNKIGERPRAKVRGQRCGTGKRAAAVQGLPPPTTSKPCLPASPSPTAAPYALLTRAFPSSPSSSRPAYHSCPASVSLRRGEGGGRARRLLRP